MILRRALIAGLLVVTGGCTTPYQQPSFKASSGASAQFTGVIDRLQAGRPLDVLLVHGMCTHDKSWAEEAIAGLYTALGEDDSLAHLESTTVPGTRVELYQQAVRTRYGDVRAMAILWSPVTAPLKEQLCYDQTQRSSHCTTADSPEPYSYERAALNRTLKDKLLNDCLSDAIIYQGRSRDQLSRQMQLAILQALTASRSQDSRQEPASVRNEQATTGDKAPLIIVTDSLGSKIAFDAIYKLVSSSDSTERTAGVATFDRVTHIFMKANQLPILALADQELDGSVGITRNTNAFPEDSLGALLRSRAIRPLTGPSPTLPTIVAFVDPNDLLSYGLTDSPHSARQNYPSVDVYTSNSLTYFGLVEVPTTAHTGYGRNETVQKLIGCGYPASERCTGEMKRH